MADLTWMGRASCRDGHDPGLWWSSDPDDLQQAVGICQGCPVREPCADRGKVLDAGEGGIWGGLVGGVRPFVPPRSCARCAVRFRPRTRRQRFCGVSCAAAHSAAVRARTVLSDDAAAVLARLDVDSLRERDQSTEAVRARWSAAAELHAAGLSSKQIGRILGRDHSTVLYGLRQVGL